MQKMLWETLLGLAIRKGNSLGLVFFSRLCRGPNSLVRFDGDDLILFVALHFAMYLEHQRYKVSFSMTLSKVAKNFL